MNQQPTIPYITLREGEEPCRLDLLRAHFRPDGQHSIGYWDQTEDDSGPGGELWGRCSQQIGPDRMPTGRPLWSLVHPARQRECMSKFRCQVCVGPTKTTLSTGAGGYLFLESSAGTPSGPGEPVLTAQPPVCLTHALVSASRCTELVRHGYRALLARRAPIHGVIGTPYQWGAQGWQALQGDDTPIPYGSPALRGLLASQLVRELREYTVVDLAELSKQAPSAAALMAI